MDANLDKTHTMHAPHLAPLSGVLRQQLWIALSLILTCVLMFLGFGTATRSERFANWLLRIQQQAARANSQAVYQSRAGFLTRIDRLFTDIIPSASYEKSGCYFFGSSVMDVGFSEYLVPP